MDNNDGLEKKDQLEVTIKVDNKPERTKYFRQSRPNRDDVSQEKINYIRAAVSAKRDISREAIYIAEDPVSDCRGQLQGYRRPRKRGGDVMDIEKFIEQLDKERRDSEKRIQQSTNNLKRELREDQQLMEQRIESRILEDRHLAEKREERIEKRFNDVMIEAEKREKRMEERYNYAIERNRWLIGLSIATIVGIAAIVVTVILR